MPPERTVRVGQLRVLAPAKVNLVLRVLDRRSDGYHNLWSLMQTVGLEDELLLTVRPGSAGVTLHCDDPTLPTDSRNLAVRAADLVLERAGRALGLTIRITKRIPVSAGLGGGSSDAAGTIFGLNRLLGLGWSLDDMARVGEQLGSDVPFFFHGPSALVGGRGEVVTPLSLSGRRWLVLVHPGFPIQTKWAYDRLAASRRTVPPLSAALTRLGEQRNVAWDEVIPLMENDFEPALLPVHGELGAIKTELLEAGAEAALLSGSGATVFGVFRQEGEALRARDLAQKSKGRRAFAVRSGSESVSVQECSAPPALPVS